MSKFMNRPPPTVMSTATLTNSSTYVEKLMIGLDHAPAAFDLRTQIIGVGGANLIYIRNETGAIATLRGRGSQFIDPALGIESPEPMHLYIEHTRLDALQNAKQLARNLIETLQQELVHFQQINPPASIQNIQYPQQHVQNIQTAHTQVISTQPVIPQMSVPPPMLAVPPPSIQTVDQMTVNQSLVQQANIVTQNTPTMVTASQTVASHHAQPQIIQQQILPGNMVIQQPVQSSLPTNLNVPPPTNIISMKQGHIVPSQVLSQPPPNIQLQQHPTQIQVLNQPPTNYQYIQQAPSDAGQQQNVVAVQHIYQPQGIVQQTQPLNTFTTQQTTVRPPSQYIVQGNTAYPCITAVPPPNIIQHQPPPIQPVHAQHQNIIFQTATSGPIPLQHLQFHPPPNIVEAQSNTNTPSDGENNAGVKDEKSSPEPSDSTRSEEKTDTDTHDGVENVQANGANISMQIPPPIRFTSAPIMAVPPPMSCVQHIVGNTLITTQAGATQAHQIYNPVSLQSIQAVPPGQQQIHVSSGQHILVNTQYPQQTFQQVQQVPQNVQSFQLTAAPQARSGANEIVMVSNQAIITPTVNQTDIRTQQPTRIFNPHMAPPTVTGMSVQFQQVMPPQVQQVVENPQVIDHPPQSNFQTQIQQINQQMQQSVNENQPKLNGIPFSVQNIPQSVPYPQQMEDSRMGLKRKRNGDEDQGPPKHLMPRMAMGSNNGGIQQQMQQYATVNTTNSGPTPATVTTTNTQDESLPPTSVANFNNFNQRMGNDNEQSQQLESRTMYYRMPPNTSAQPNPAIQSNAPIMMGGLPPRGSHRFNSNNNPGHLPMHRINFGPPPPSSQGPRPRFANR